MAVELAMRPLSNPAAAVREWRAIAAYRRTQEDLRIRGGYVGPDSQLHATASRLSLSPDMVAAIVETWMARRPLKYLRLCARSGTLAILDFLRERGIRCGLLSDYPVGDKLATLNLKRYFDPVLCTSDAEIGVLKPNPLGFLRVCEMWNLPPHEVLVIGDRVEVDGAGAAAAGMPSVIIGKHSGRAPLPCNCLVVSSFERLYDVLDSRS
jgi:HAD superfamily hydrolase (TIGR01549 family)